MPALKGFQDAVRRVARRMIENDRLTGILLVVCGPKHLDRPSLPRRCPGTPGSCRYWLRATGDLLPPAYWSCMLFVFACRRISLSAPFSRMANMGSITMKTPSSTPKLPCPLEKLQKLAREHSLRAIKPETTAINPSHQPTISALAAPVERFVQGRRKAAPKTCLCLCRCAGGFLEPRETIRVKLHRVSTRTASS